MLSFKEAVGILREKCVRLTGNGERIDVVDVGNTVARTGCTGILVKNCCDSVVYGFRDPGIDIVRV